MNSLGIALAAFATLHWPGMVPDALAQFDPGARLQKSPCGVGALTLPKPSSRFVSDSSTGLLGSASATLWSFGKGEDGRFPQAGLTEDASGAFYGTTGTGGQFNLGSVFKLTPSGSTYTERILWSFGGTMFDGTGPTANIVRDASGALYGTTFAGGLAGTGTAFKLTPAGSAYAEQIIHNFGSNKDAAMPYGSLLADSTGALYGTTISGGARDFGAVFKLTPSGSTYREELLWRFQGTPDAANSFAGLIAGKNHVLYGTTEVGGAWDGGTVFSLTPSAQGYKEKVLWSFGGGPGDGACIYSPVVLHRGVLYGTAYSRGAYGVGTAYELIPANGSWKEHILWHFGKGQDGSSPGNGGLIADAAGNLFGTTLLGGAGGVGSVFEISPSGPGFSERVILSFQGPNGNGPNSSVLLNPSGALYGTAELGGRYNYGTVFSVTP